MVAGRSGTQKSGLALFLADEWQLPSLYFSADMSAFTASTRLACKRMGLTTEEVELIMAVGGPEKDALIAQLSTNIVFSFGSPIRWETIDEELEAWVELNNSYPSLIVFDNVMDFEGAESDYTAQMEVLSGATDLARATGATTLLLHHASDKSWDAKMEPWKPPSRDQIKNGLAEKPELCLTVALDPSNNDYNIACVKQRMGPCDPTAQRYATLKAVPENTRFTTRDGIF
jgi:hypothetical protein